MSTFTAIIITAVFVFIERALIYIGWGTFVVANIAFVLATHHYFSARTKGQSKAQSNLLNTINEQYGTNFQSQNGTGGFYFDANSKKFLFDMKSGPLVKGIDYIRSYELTWTERTVGNKLRFENVQLEFHTTDINDPLLKSACPSKEYGEVLMAKLGIIFDS